MFTPVPQAQPGCVRGQITGLDDRLADSAYRNAETALRKLHTDHRYPGSRFQVLSMIMLRIVCIVGI
jgi:hypothetical protein